MAFKIKMRLLLWRDSEGNNRIIFIRWQPVRTANERDSGIVLDINFCHVPCKSQERWRVAQWYQRMQCLLFYSHKRVENTLLQDLKLILWWFHNSVDNAAGIHFYGLHGPFCSHNHQFHLWQSLIEKNIIYCSIR